MSLLEDEYKFSKTYKKQKNKNNDKIKLKGTITLILDIL